MVSVYRLLLAKLIDHEVTSWFFAYSVAVIYNSDTVASQISEQPVLAPYKEMAVRNQWKNTQQTKLFLNIYYIKFGSNCDKLSITTVKDYI